jgi:hypothetical protein
MPYSWQSAPRLLLTQLPTPAIVLHTGMALHLQRRRCDHHYARPRHMVYLRIFVCFTKTASPRLFSTIFQLICPLVSLSRPVACQKWSRVAVLQCNLFSPPSPWPCWHRLEETILHILNAYSCVYILYALCRNSSDKTAIYHTQAAHGDYCHLNSCF